MPKKFKSCVKKGGRVRTIKRGKGKYQHLCFLNGSSSAGHIKKTKKRKKRK